MSLVLMENREECTAEFGSIVRIGADINWSYNIMREVIPTVFDRGIEDIVVCPVSITPNQAKSQLMLYLIIFLVTISVC